MDIEEDEEGEEEEEDEEEGAPLSMPPELDRGLCVADGHYVHAAQGRNVAEGTSILPISLSSISPVSYRYLFTNILHRVVCYFEKQIRFALACSRTVTLARGREKEKVPAQVERFVDKFDLDRSAAEKRFRCRRPEDADWVARTAPLAEAPAFVPAPPPAPAAMAQHRASAVPSAAPSRATPRFALQRINLLAFGFHRESSMLHQTPKARPLSKVRAPPIREMIWLWSTIG